MNLFGSIFSGGWILIWVECFMSGGGGTAVRLTCFNGGLRPEEDIAHDTNQDHREITITAACVHTLFY